MVFLVAITVTILMLTFVIPEFENIFKGFGAELPWFTQQVINISHNLQEYGLHILLLMMLTILMLSALKKKSYFLE